ncbi:hypothetical protein D3C81_1863920 [compost metagenome]
MGGVHHPRRHLSDCRLLINFRTQAFNQLRQTTDQLARVDQRAVLGIKATQRFLSTNACLGFSSPKHAPLIGEPKACRRLDSCSGSLHLWFATCQRQEALLGVVSVHPFQSQYPANLVDCFVHCSLQMQSRAVRVQLLYSVQ